MSNINSLEVLPCHGPKYYDRTAGRAIAAIEGLLYELDEDHDWVNVLKDAFQTLGVDVHSSDERNRRGVDIIQRALNGCGFNVIIAIDPEAMEEREELYREIREE